MTQVHDNTSQHGRLPVVLVTGPSGAGRSTAVRALEDLGYEVIDNLPLSLLPRLLDGPQTGRPLALGVDVRNRDFDAEVLLDLLDDLVARADLDTQMLYLDASEDTLVRRYSETRRRHPLSPDSSPTAGIASEIAMMGAVRERAEMLINTSDLSPHGLKAEIERLFGGTQGAVMGVTVQSFSYKRGLPRGADMVFDCRFLRNPHWDPALRSMDGRDQAVVNYVTADPKHQEFFDRVYDLVMFLLPAYKDEGKSHLGVGLGCTGGQHRSVAVTEMLASALEKAGWPVSIRHRELDRRDGQTAKAQPSTSRHTA
ncbi:MAG: RNase adapter RapZ [Pseudomonadota bacterium]